MSALTFRRKQGVPARAFAVYLDDRYLGDVREDPGKGWKANRAGEPTWVGGPSAVLWFPTRAAATKALAS